MGMNGKQNHDVFSGNDVLGASSVLNSELGLVAVEAKASKAKASLLKSFQENG